MEDSSSQGMKPDSDTGEETKAIKSKTVNHSPFRPSQHVGDIPRGIEALVKKASVDPEFRALLLEKRSDVAHEIDLQLSAAEVAMFDSVPLQQIETIIEKTSVPDEHRRIFLGKVATAMLALTGVVLSSGCDTRIWPDPLRNVTGISPYLPPGKH